MLNLARSPESQTSTDIRGAGRIDTTGQILQGVGPIIEGNR
jgi:hypothetical protein